MSDAADTPYEEVLATLHGWLGQTLEVGVATAGDRPVMIGHMAGQLRAGVERSADGTDGAVFFHFEDGKTGFVLSRETFSGAGWHADDLSLLVVRLGDVSLWISPDSGDRLPRAAG